MVVLEHCQGSIGSRLLCHGWLWAAGKAPLPSQQVSTLSTIPSSFPFQEKSGWVYQAVLSLPCLVVLCIYFICLWFQGWESERALSLLSHWFLIHHWNSSTFVFGRTKNNKEPRYQNKCGCLSMANRGRSVLSGLYLLTILDTKSLWDRSSKGGDSGHVKDWQRCVRVSVHLSAWQCCCLAEL